MILRHLTTIEKIESILSDGFLRGSNNMRTAHKGHVSFEVFNPNCERTAFVKAFSVAKKVNLKDVVELFFDAEKMKSAGIEIRNSFINGKKDTKVELSIFPEVTESDFKSIGDYCFVYGEVSLDFLTEQTKRELYN